MKKQLAQSVIIAGNRSPTNVPIPLKLEICVDWFALGKNSPLTKFLIKRPLSIYTVTKPSDDT